MTEVNTAFCGKEINQTTESYILVEKGFKWKCIRCGGCCRTDFEEHWLDFICTDQDLGTINGKCSKLLFENNTLKCSIYLIRPNACKAFPFTLKKQVNGRYKLVIHAKCCGSGNGGIIDIKQKIQQCLRYSNREFHKRMQFDYESFEIDRSVVLVK